MAGRLTPEDRLRRIAAFNEMNARGLTYAEAANLIGQDGRRFREWCVDYAYRLRQRDGSAKPKPGRSWRSCMCCKVLFTSAGPHNRLCGPCGQRSVSPYTPGGSGDTGRRVGAVRS
jgi:hypothetical protein